MLPRQPFQRVGERAKRLHELAGKCWPMAVRLRAAPRPRLIVVGKRSPPPTSRVPPSLACATGRSDYRAMEGWDGDNRKSISRLNRQDPRIIILTIRGSRRLKRRLRNERSVGKLCLHHFYSYRGCYRGRICISPRRTTAARMRHAGIGRFHCLAGAYFAFKEHITMMAHEIQANICSELCATSAIRGLRHATVLVQSSSRSERGNSIHWPSAEGDSHGWVRESPGRHNRREPACVLPRQTTMAAIRAFEEVARCRVSSPMGGVRCARWCRLELPRC
jgi:hypothetical protein